MIDKNLLLQKFVKDFGLDTEGFIVFCNKNGIDEPNVLVEEFKSMQNQIYDKIWEITEPDLQLDSKEILKISNDYLVCNFEWIDQNGIKVLNNWLMYMCWHDGISK